MRVGAGCRNKKLVSQAGKHAGSTGRIRFGVNVVLDFDVNVSVNELDVGFNISASVMVSAMRVLCSGVVAGLH